MIYVRVFDLLYEIGQRFDVRLYREFDYRRLRIVRVEFEVLLERPRFVRSAVGDSDDSCLTRLDDLLVEEV